jgi:hypothetical protein
MTTRLLATIIIGILSTNAGGQPAHAQVVQQTLLCGKCEVKSYEARGKPAHESISRVGVCYSRTTKWLSQMRVDENCFDTPEACLASVKVCIQSVVRPR